MRRALFTRRVLEQASGFTLCAASEPADLTLISTALPDVALRTAELARDGRLVIAVSNLTREGPAPRAMRIPISCVRWLTE